MNMERGNYMQLKSFAYRLSRTKQPATWLAYATQAPERLGRLIGCYASIRIPER